MFRILFFSRNFDVAICTLFPPFFWADKQTPFTFRKYCLQCSQSLQHAVCLYVVVLDMNLQVHNKVTNMWAGFPACGAWRLLLCTRRGQSLPNRAPRTLNRAAKQWRSVSPTVGHKERYSLCCTCWDTADTVWNTMWDTGDSVRDFWDTKCEIHCGILGSVGGRIQRKVDWLWPRFCGKRF